MNFLKWKLLARMDPWSNPWRDLALIGEFFNSPLIFVFIFSIDSIPFSIGVTITYIGIKIKQIVQHSSLLATILILFSSPGNVVCTEIIVFLMYCSSIAPWYWADYGRSYLRTTLLCKWSWPDKFVSNLRTIMNSLTQQSIFLEMSNTILKILTGKIWFQRSDL
jgi:hypothetical protein